MATQTVLMPGVVAALTCEDEVGYSIRENSDREIMCSNPARRERHA